MKVKNKMKNKKPYFKREILMDDRYPIGWGTGLSSKEWREFADNYVPFNERESER